MKALYIRVSTVGQNPDRQNEDTEGFQVFEDRCSGSVPFAERPAGSRIMAALKAGDLAELHVHELSRFGRDLLDTLTTIQRFTEAGVPVVLRKGGIRTLGPSGSRTSPASSP